MTLRCSVCNTFIVPGRLKRVRKYCSSSCRQIAYRQRKIASGLYIYRGYFYKQVDLVGEVL